MPGIFINYRRDDAAGAAGRLYDHLARSFSHGSLFMDVDAMKPGRDFVKQLDDQVARCDALLAIIGPRWFNASDEKGQRRLDTARDYVRIEIASALQRDIPVIPILVDGAEMPHEDDLPDDLKSLARRHALELRHTRFVADCDAIVHALHEALPRTTNRWRWPMVGGGLAAACIAASVAYWALYVRPPSPTVAPVAAPATSPAPRGGDQAAARQPIEAKGAAPSAEALNQAVPAPTVRKSPAEAPSQAAPRPSGLARVETLTVALGDSYDKVKSTYPSAADSGSGDLNMPLDGLRFFFGRDDKRLRTIRADAPFAGTIQGVHIGDTPDDIVGRLGQPYSISSDGKTYFYHIDGNVIRYDLDKSSKVGSIFAILGRK